MKERTRTFAAVLLGALLVVGGVGAGIGPAPDGLSPVGDAEAQPVICGDLVKSQGPLVMVNPKAFTCSGPDAENLSEADALETKKSIYNTASAQAQNNENLLTVFGNYLEDTESVALMEAKNAYIKALNNGTSEAIARNRATEAVADYYAVKQRNLIAQWNTTLTVANSSRFTAKNTTNVSPDFADVTVSTDQYWERHSMTLNTTATVTLTNGTTVDTRAYSVTLRNTGGAGYDTATFTPSGYDGSNTVEGFTSGIHVKPPTDSYSRLTLLNNSEFWGRWSEIQTQQDAVNAEMDVFINETYDAYRAGEINSSDLVTPGLVNRYYAADGDFQSWALKALAGLDIEPPENLSNIGEMRVYSFETSQTYTGILMSEQTPGSGYTVGSTYNASKIGGLQMVVTANTTVQLDGRFQLKSAEDASGNVYQENETIQYTNITYKTANTSEFQALQRQLQNLTAQVNARQQRLRNAGGGGGLFGGLGGLGFGGLGGLGAVAPVVLVAGGAAVLVLGRS